MKKAFAVFLFFLVLIPTRAFAHAGEVHSYMGTITTQHKDGSFMLKKTDGKTIHVHVGKTTEYLHADGHLAKAEELKPGLRVVVKMSKDGKTALNVKMAAAAKKK
jgi:hypothetical protein